MKKLLKGLVPVAFGILAISANAATTSQSFQVTATVSAACTLATTGMAFGAINPSAASPSSATNTITSTCTNTTPYTLSFGKGTGVDYATRSMAGTAGSTDKLLYNIYQEAAFTNVVGDGTASTVTIAKVGTGVAQATTLFGRVTGSQFVKPDTYTDTIAVTLTY